MPGKSYTWEELASHNTRESAWVAVNGKVYDVTEFVDRHPGGADYVLMGAGRECTDLFKSYHPFTDKPAQVLSKYEIGTLSSVEHLTFAPDSGFYAECCKRVGKYFKDNNIHHKDPWPGVWRCMVCLIVLGITFCMINHIIEVPLWGRVLAALVFGVYQALILMHHLHDATHSSLGYGPSWWKTFGTLSMEWVCGGSCTSWFHQHVLGHHIYTNVMGADPDMPMVTEGDLRFLVPQQAWKSLYKYQHIYMPILYGLLATKFKIQDVTWTYGSHQNGPIRVNPLPRDLWINMIVTKVNWVFWRLIAPWALFGVGFTEFFVLFWITELVTGYYLAFNFQVSHISTECYFPASEAKFEPSLKDEWAVVQVLGSIDYAHNSPLAAYLSGALNYQTVHHLFPGVSQYHYPAIAPIVKEVCKEYKIPFNHVDTFTEAIRMHIDYLYQMGKQGKKAE